MPPPTLLSFDIGTRHLAYCTLHHATTPPTITHWKVVDLLAVPGTPYDDSCTYILAKSWKCPALRAYLDHQHLSSVGTRKTLVDRVHADLKARKVPKVAGTNLCVLATKLYAYLDSQPWMTTECQTVVLENQPCLTNPIMKSVQMLLYGYFMYTGVWCRYQGGGHTADDALPRVMLTSATNKLKVCAGELRGGGAGDEGVVEGDESVGGGDESVGGGEKGETEPTDLSLTGKAAYKNRKQAAIALTDTLLTQWHTDAPLASESRQQLATWRELLASSCMKEKDDLSDSFLQGLFVIRKAAEGRQKAEEKRQRAEDRRLKAEEKRQKAEEKRHKAEEKRQRAEEKRLKAEDRRLKAEETRQKADDHPSV